MLWNGHPKLSDKQLGRVVRYAVLYCGLVVTATNDGVHASGSYHYKNRAVDLGVRDGIAGTAAGLRRLKRAQIRIRKHFGDAFFTEYFGPYNDQCVRNGRRINLAEGTPLENQHDNHIHVAR